MTADDIRDVIQLPMPVAACRHVLRVVTARLRDVPGVVTVEVKTRTSAVVVTGHMSRAAVEKAAADAYQQIRHLPDCPATP